MKPAIHLWHKFLLLFTVALAAASPARAWWNDAWTLRKAMTVENPVVGAAPLHDVPVLVRLHAANFDFGSAREDGADLRFVGADDKTPLTYHIAQYDSLLSEAFVWVKIPEVKAGEPAKFWLYYGNPAAAPAVDSRATYDPTTALVYHFGERDAPPRDWSGHDNVAGNTGVRAEGTLIGVGVRFDGSNGITIPASPSLAWAAGAAVTWSAWIRPAALAANTVIYSRREKPDTGWVVGFDEHGAFTEVIDEGRARRASGSIPIAVREWHHLAVVADGKQVTVYLDGKNCANMAAALPALATPATVGADSAGQPYAGFHGELVELQIANAARTEAEIQFAAASQGGEAQAVRVGVDEAAGPKSVSGLSRAVEHVMLFGDIAKNMMFDGWCAVFVCVIMIVIGWSVALTKLAYLNRIHRGSEVFLEQWNEVSDDLTALNHSDVENVRTMGGTIDAAKHALIEQSPLYHLYHIGSDQIRRRFEPKDGARSLSVRSIQVIKTKLDAGLTRELHRLNRGLVYLTISIAGGPYIGLLGTVVGVMVTFAVIARSGEVEVASIAPGIASALLATVAGLLVAIPALFIYSYLNNRIKEMTSNMRLFIDEFVARMAEAYPARADEPGASAVEKETA